MKSKKKILIACLIIIFVCAVVSVIGTITITEQAEAENLETIQLEDKSNTPVNDKVFPDYVYKDEGYDNFALWWSDLKGKRNSFEGQASVVIEELGAHLTDEERQKLETYEKNITSAISFTTIEENESLFNEIVDKARLAKEESEKTVDTQSYISDVSVDSWDNSNYGSYYYPSNSGVLTKSSGVNWYNGRKETWYSSNVLYHYRTGEWTVGSDGVYRDSNGYVIVAASDLAQGSTVDTSYGTGKVYDTGCAPGTTDIYVNW